MKTKQRRPLIIATAVCALALLGMVLALTAGEQASTVVFTPPAFDEAAQPGTPEVPESLGWAELDAQAFKASVCGVFAPAGNTVDVYLTNPVSNTVWLKLRVLDTEGNILGETGLIKPGEYVQSVTLTAIPDAGANITFKLMAYQPNTYYSEGAVSLSTTLSAE